MRSARDTSYRGTARRLQAGTGHGRSEATTITVELLGLARVLARRERVTLSLAPDASVSGRGGGVGAPTPGPADTTVALPRLRDVARALAAAYPALVGAVLTPDGTLGPGTLFSLDGRAVTDDLSQPVPEARLGEAGGECVPTVLLLTSLEGGA